MLHKTEFRLALAIGLLGVAQAVPAAAASITCCEDESGRRICADILPQACYGRAYREISPQGSVTKVVPAPLTAEERMRAEQEEKARKALDEKERTQRRRDQALLETYSSVDDLEAQRQRAVADLDKDLTLAYRRENEALERRTKLQMQAQAYAKKPLPPDLASELEENEGELAAQRSVILAKQRVMEATMARYDSDRRRLAELMAEKGKRR